MKVLSKNELVSLVRAKADLESSNFVSDEEIGRYLDLAYSHLYNMIVDTNEDFFLDSVFFSGSNDPSQLPADFYKFRALDYFWSGKFFVPARPIGFNSRFKEQRTFFRPYNYYDNAVHDGIMYSLRGRELRIFMGIENERVDFALWYIPTPKKIGEGATLPAGWERYLIHSACLDARNKQDTSTREFERLMMRDKEEILSSCQERDYNTNEMIEDVEDDYAEIIEERYFDGGLSGRNAEDNILAPSLGSKTYLPADLVEYASKKKYYIFGPKVAAVGLELPAGVRGSYGSWLIVVMYKDRGNVYLSQRLNSSLSLEQAWNTVGELNIEPNVYLNNTDFYGRTKLFYSEITPYTWDKDNIGEPPREDVHLGEERIGAAVYWANSRTPARVVESDLTFGNDGKVELTIPTPDPANGNDQYLVVAVLASRQLQALYYGNQNVNQVSTFGEVDDSLGINYYVTTWPLNTLIVSGKIKLEI